MYLQRAGHPSLTPSAVCPPSQKKALPSRVVPLSIGGAKRDRTADLNTASVALSQLSYSPKVSANSLIRKEFLYSKINEEVAF
jgi:hypothetical protein